MNEIDDTKKSINEESTTVDVDDVESASTDNADNQSEEQGVETVEKSDAQGVIKSLFSQPQVLHFIGDVINGDEPSVAAQRYFPQSQDFDCDAFSSQCDTLSIPQEARDGIEKSIEQSLMGDKTRLYQLLVKGCNYDNALKVEGQKGYIRGKNERIEAEVNDTFFPGEVPNLGYNEILANPRKSVWDD